MKQIVLQGGYVVDGQGVHRADVLVEGDKIKKIGHVTRDAAWDAEVVDVREQYLFPGFIDAHTHFALDVCNTTTADDFASGSLAALCGGTTTVIDFAAPDKGESLLSGLARWRKKAEGKTFCDYGFHMTIDDWNKNIAAELDDIFAAGITSFKMYTTYPAMMLDDGSIYQVLRELHKRGGVCGIHCENSALIDACIAERKDAGYGAEVISHALSRPDCAEAEAVARVLHLAQAAQSPVIIVHLSSKAALEEVAHARHRGQSVYVETCPQYLLLDDSAYCDSDYDRAAGFVCAPPLRGAKDQIALWNGLHKGSIQTVSTDHCSFTVEQKRAGEKDFTKIPGGLPGVETRAELLYTAGVAKNRISLATYCRVLSENPAKLYGLFPRKGILQAGSDADIVVYDPKASRTLSATALHSKAGYTPHEGFVTAGSVAKVYLRGALVAQNGEPCCDKAEGQYLARGVCAL